MEGLSATAILKVVAEYGVLGLGWVAWILQVYYNQVERKRYQALVFHIIEYFTKVNLSDHESEEPKHVTTFAKLFGKDIGG